MRTIFSRLARRRARTVFLASVSATLLGGAVVGCGLISSNIFDVTIGLSSQTYGHDFGSTTGNAPSITCPVTPDPCGALATQIPGGSNGHCDLSTSPSVCAADVSVVLAALDAEPIDGLVVCEQRR
jgi:hypothetical protein